MAKFFHEIIEMVDLNNRTFFVFCDDTTRCREKQKHKIRPSVHPELHASRTLADPRGGGGRGHAPLPRGQAPRMH